MDIWDIKLDKAKEHWEHLFTKLYGLTFEKTISDLDVHPILRVKTAVCTYKEAKLVSVTGEYNKFLNSRIIMVEVETSDGKKTISVFPNFELKSDGKIVGEPILFELIVDSLTAVVTEQTIV